MGNRRGTKATARESQIESELIFSKAFRRSAVHGSVCCVVYEAPFVSYVSIATNHTHLFENETVVEIIVCVGPIRWSKSASNANRRATVPRTCKTHGKTKGVGGGGGGGWASKTLSPSQIQYKLIAYFARRQKDVGAGVRSSSSHYDLGGSGGFHRFVCEKRAGKDACC